jgi:creatinine amidohydrolase/Fe(II)-dependent formamide hydrolase-like protein
MTGRLAICFRRLVLVVAAAAASAVAPAAPPPAVSAPATPSVFLDDMTWTDVRDAVAAGRTTVLIPAGGTEQSGPHMALGKHNVRAHVLAGRIATQLGNAVVAPVVAYVPEGTIEPPAGHMRYPGTISVPPDAFRAVVEGAARSLRRAGFRDIVLLGDHGGYQSDLAAVAAKLNREWAASPVRVHFISEYYRAGVEPFAAALRERGLSTAQIGEHAGAADTALMLAVDPSLVRADRMAAAPSAGDGTRGDPRPATAALGQVGIDAIVGRSVAAIRKAVVR